MEIENYRISTVLMVALVFVSVACVNKQANEEATSEGDALYTAPLGIQAYTYRHSFPVDVVATLDTIQQLGFTELEGSGGDMPPEEFRKLCEERGISIPSTGADYEELVKDPAAIAARAKSM